MKERVYEYAMHSVQMTAAPGEKLSQLEKIEAWFETLPKELEQEAILYTVDKYDGRGAQATFLKHPRLTEAEKNAVDAQNPTMRKLEAIQVCVCLCTQHSPSLTITYPLSYSPTLFFMRPHPPSLTHTNNHSTLPTPPLLALSPVTVAHHPQVRSSHSPQPLYTNSQPNPNPNMLDVACVCPNLLTP